MKKLHGVTTAMVTPMQDDGLVDLEATKKLTDFLIEKGINCLYPLGTTGEMLKLSLDERKSVARTVVESANNRVNVFIHVGAMTTADTLELAKHAYEIGADGIGVVTPVFFSANDEEIESFYSTISNALPNDFPIYLYSIPQLSGNTLPVSVVRSLAEKHENIIGVKYSYPDFLTLKDYLSIKPNEFSVLTGTDALFVPALAMGCDGVISGVSGVFPEPFVEVLDAYHRGDLKRARELQAEAEEIIQILKAGSNMSFFKKGLNYRGVEAGSVRAPQQDINDEAEKELIEKIEKWMEALSFNM